MFMFGMTEKLSSSTKNTMLTKFRLSLLLIFKSITITLREEVNMITYNYHKYTLTIILLCVGYYIDFYDLTIFSASYNDIIQDLFHIYDKTEIQLLYLKITNFNNAGIIVGGVMFGILGDKYGRSTVIRYSILLYSISIILSCYTHSTAIFCLLRFLSGVGLATEFATSSVLISEMLPKDIAVKSTAWLYFCGILGGMSATFLSMVSWNIMFLFGGVGGIVLYIARKKLFESPLFLEISPDAKKGNPLILFNNIPNLIKTLKLAVLITPFYFLISIMFILPNFMNLNIDLSQTIHTLLIGFFIGNLVSTIAWNYFISYIKSFRSFFIINSIAFITVLGSFSFVTQTSFFVYTIFLGVLGGGLPSIWIQLVAKHYGTNQRNTATNILYVFGRGSGIIFNLLISAWLINPKNFGIYSIITTIILAVISIIVILNTKNVYKTNIDYLN